MKTLRKHATWVLTGAFWALLAGAPAYSDDTELFVGAASPELTGQPNILFIVDTSGSMRSEVEALESYDASVTYPGACTAARVYWSEDSDPPPECGGNRWFNATAFTCDAALQALEGNAGRYTDLMVQFDDANDIRWEDIDAPQKAQLVECESDSGIHGDGTSSSGLYARNGNANAPWTNNPNNEIAWGQAPANQTYTVYDANYVNWYHGPTGVLTRIDVVKDVATSLISSIEGVNVGLMRFNETEGGPVIHAMEDVATARSGILSTIASLDADGFTPLSETLYEAGLYYLGGNVDYGNVQGPPNSVDAARTEPGSELYESPVEFMCQRNFIVLLTDGAPTEDLGTPSRITSLPDYGAVVGGGCDGSGDGACLDDMAEYLQNADLSGALADIQNVITYTIGFAVDLPILESTALRGGGEYFTANDTASLTTALSNIVTSILETQTTFSTPAVAVNSFNRTQNLNDLFVAVFQPSSNFHWPGNLKKYRLNPETGAIVDATGANAVDSDTGFFLDSSRSLWSVVEDGADVREGGAASRLPSPAARRLFTYLGSSDLTSASNAVDTANGLIDESLLGLGAPGDPTVDDVISFARGADVNDADFDGDDAEPRYEAGDPLHSQPVTVIYGGSPASPDIDDALVFFSTNDGYLHAVDPTDGSEVWAFIPPEFLEDLVQLYENDPSADKHYGVDGSPTVQLVQTNSDGIIDPNAGERAYLFFGMRRGGVTYYALDITAKNSPRLLWRLDGSDLPGIGQTWSKPVATRVAVGDGSNQNDERLVLVIGGGYDASQDALAAGTDVVGNAIYIVDSVSGELLWHASQAGADRNLPQMQYSIPSDIKVIDLDADRFADRLYTADMGGQVWRFDIFHGQQPANLVTGGVLAQLGGAPADPAIAADSRRFYYAPDIALVNDRDATFIHIGIGSGHRAHPNSIVTQDRFYALRDYLPFGKRSQPEYDALGSSPITNADLIDVTDDIDTIVPPGSAGWRLDLRNGGWVGEKVLAEARTFDNQIFFTTFTPDVGGPQTDCRPRLGTNRLYIVDILSGRPVNNLDESVDEENLTVSDRFTEFNGSISSEVVFLFPSPEDENCVGDQCTPPPVACVDLFCFDLDFTNNPIRTFWSQESTY